MNATRLRISARVDRVYSPEDAAASAFNSLWQRVQRGEYPDLNDRDSLWRMLLIITTRKLIAQDRRLQSQKRGAGAAVGESALINPMTARGQSIMFSAKSPRPNSRLNSLIKLR